jgi:hypothetical protein
MSDNPLNGKGNGHELSATEISPADFPLGSPRSRAIARALAERKTAKPKLSQADEDALTIYGEISCLGYGLAPGLMPSPRGIQNTAVYARGEALSAMLRGPITPSHSDEHFKRSTPESRKFEEAFGREPQAGDILRYRHVALVNHPDLLEVKCYLFTEAWRRQIPGLLCPKRVEGGRLFIHGVENIDVQPQAIWREFERHIKWLALGKPNGLRLGPLDLSLDEIPTIPALIFEGVGPREQYGGTVEEKHRCRPATKEEMQRPEIEPPKGSVLALLHTVLKQAEQECGKTPSESGGANR